jgi:hypothetical protein
MRRSAPPAADRHRRDAGATKIGAEIRDRLVSY